MRNSLEKVTNLAARKGLYRIWVRADDREGSRLVARWTDLRVEENGSRAEDKNFICDEISCGGDSAELQSDSALQLTAAGAF
jgi:hypothetical protein